MTRAVHIHVHVPIPVQVDVHVDVNGFACGKVAPSYVFFVVKLSPNN